MARTLYKYNLEVYQVKHPAEATDKVKWYPGFVVMAPADRTTYLSANSSLKLTLTKATSTEKTNLLKDEWVVGEMNSEKSRRIREKYSVDQELKMARTPDSDTSKAMATDIAAIVKGVDDEWDAEFNIS